MKDPLIVSVILGFLIFQGFGVGADIFEAYPRLISDTTRIKNNRPIIGILTQEVTGKITEIGHGQCILASYVKMVESAGARVAPVFIDQTPQEIEKMFNSINGIIFPGGHVKLNVSRYGVVGKQIFELALKANRDGRVFPIWAECLGLELITLVTSGKGLGKGQYDESFLSPTDSRNYNIPLILSSDYRNSTLFGSVSQSIIDYIQQYPIAYNNHDKGVSSETFRQYKGLTDAFRIVSTNYDRIHNEFISTLEGRKFPFFLFHWHPAKTQFEWSTLKNIYHSQETVLLAQHLADVFINQARLSDHKFPSLQQERDALIYNYLPTYTEGVASFMQVYFFQYSPPPSGN